MPTTSATPGMIEDGVTYTQAEFCKRMGWGRKAFDAARRRGLRTFRSGKRLYVAGEEGREFLKRDGDSQAKVQS